MFRDGDDYFDNQDDYYDEYIISCNVDGCTNGVSTRCPYCGTNLCSKHKKCPDCYKEKQIVRKFTVDTKVVFESDYSSWAGYEDACAALRKDKYELLRGRVQSDSLGGCFSVFMKEKVIKDTYDGGTFGGASIGMLEVT